jgi:hypothetical protein
VVFIGIFVSTKLGDRWFSPGIFVSFTKLEDLWVSPGIFVSTKLGDR